MHHSNTSYSSRSYLTLDRATEISGITLPELKRAIVLGSIRVADIGNTTFVDSLSLDEYLLSRGRESRVTKKTEMSNFLSPKERSFQEENHTNPKEREVFREALARDQTTSTLLSAVPYVFIGVFVLFSLVLSLPTSQSNEDAPLVSAEVYKASTSLKEVTTEYVIALLTETSVADTVNELAPMVATERSGQRDFFALHRESLGANALEVWFESIGDGLKKLALAVYDTVETFARPLR